MNKYFPKTINTRLAVLLGLSVLAGILFIAFNGFSKNSPLIALDDGNAVTMAKGVVSGDSEAPDSNLGLIYGQVSSQDGVDLTGIKICAIGEDTTNNFEILCQSPSLNEKSYSLTLKPGDYQFFAYGDGHDMKSISLSVLAGDHRQADFLLTKETPLPLRGVVTSATGEAVENAEVTIIQYGELVSFVTSNERGEFAASAPTGPVFIQTVAAGFSRNRFLTATPDANVNIVLYPGVSLNGIVLEKGSDRPLANVTVNASPNSTGLHAYSQLNATTNDDGEFRLDGLQQGRYFLQLRDAKWASHPSPFTVNNTGANAPAILYGETGYQFAGVMLSDNADGFCTQGEVVLTGRYFDQERGIWLTRAEVGEDGSIRFPALVGGSYQIAANCYEQSLLDNGVDRVELAADTEPVQWTFSTGQQLRVKVSDGLGRPMDTATVAIRLASDPENIKQGFVTPLGDYTFGSITPGKYEVRASLNELGIEPLLSSVTVSPGDALTELSLSFPAASRIVIDVNTIAGSTATQHFFFASDRDGNRYEALYSGNNQYLISPLLPGQYQVFAYDNKNPRTLLSQGDSQWLSIDSNEDKALTFTPNAFSGRITGRVMGADGIGLSNVNIRAFGSTLNAEDASAAALREMVFGPQGAVTNEEGYFSLSNIDPDEFFTLYVKAPNGFEVDVSNIRAADFKEFTLPEPASWKGTVTYLSGTPVAQFEIEIHDSNQSSTPIFESFESEDGAFSFSMLSPGRKRIIAHDVEKGKQWETTINLASGENVINIAPK